MISKNLLLAAALAFGALSAQAQATSAGSCYDPQTHVVACNVSDESCAETSYWYEPNYKSKHSGCCHCTASCDEVSDECSYNDDEEEETHHGEGEVSDGSCYDPTTHVVACDVSDEQCPATSYWYEPNFKSKHSGCCHCAASCDEVSDECTYNDSQKEDTHHGEGEKSEGSCYDPSTHVVACDVSDVQCAATSYWYEPNFKSKHSGCCHCRASCDETSDECTYNDDTKEDTHHGEGEKSDGSCYSMQTHVVTCDVSDEECPAKSYWYEPGYKSKHSGCCHCRASCDDVDEECSYNDDEKEETTFGEGESNGSCYDPSTHVVSCDMSDGQCPKTSYWYEPGYKSKNSGCCHCRASCDDVSDTCEYHDDVYATDGADDDKDSNHSGHTATDAPKETADESTKDSDAAATDSAATETPADFDNAADDAAAPAIVTNEGVHHAGAHALIGALVAVRAIMA